MVIGILGPEQPCRGCILLVTNMFELPKWQVLVQTKLRRRSLGLKYGDQKSTIQRRNQDKMSQLSLAAVTVNQIPLDWEGNLQRIEESFNMLTQKGYDLICYPEMCLTGYGCEDQFLSKFTTQKAHESLLKLAQRVNQTIVVVGVPFWIEDKLYNVAAILFQQKVVAFIPKQFLANDGVHYEPRWFTAWEKNGRVAVDFNGDKVPFGDYLLEFDGVRLGIEICQDAWEGDKRPAHELSKRGANLICNPTASHFSFGKNLIRQSIAKEGSEIVNGVYVFANLLGNESGRTIFDGDAYVYEKGQKIAETHRFSFEEFNWTGCNVSFSSKQSNSDPSVIQINFTPSTKAGNIMHVGNEFESAFIKEEEFARSVSLALWDYMRKSYSNGWVLSLSGGADSSAIASLCYLSIQLAIRDLGLEGVKKSLKYFKSIQACVDVKGIIQKALTTVYQGTQNSSEETRNSAKKLAENVGSTHYEIEIDKIVAEYRNLIEGAIGRELTWQTDDITLQNVQARVRAPSAWMLANIQNALLLATSNRSEASVGYATMDGDTSGSISPISGIDKTYIREWLKWMEKVGVDGQLSLSQLKFVNDLEPSAELRPLETKQVDEEDLMPYPILNFIEKSAFRNKNSPELVYRELIEVYDANYSKEKLWEFADRYFRLWARNQWKRERYAPGFHVDDYSLDPKSWLRFPILSAGLAKDLPQKP